ncbi:MAG: hypothetical protein ACRDBG_23475 [Waterburya sp.]
MLPMPSLKKSNRRARRLFTTAKQVNAFSKAMNNMVVAMQPVLQSLGRLNETLQRAGQTIASMEHVRQVGKDAANMLQRHKRNG